MINFTYEVPLFELIFTAAITALVSGLTICISLQGARRQTKKALMEARKQEIRATIPSLSLFAEASRRPEWMDVNTLRPAYESSLITIRASGLPYCKQVSQWVSAIITYASTHEARFGSKLAIVQGTGLLETGAAPLITSQIESWLIAPDKVGSELAGMLVRLQDANAQNAVG